MKLDEVIRYPRLIGVGSAAPTKTVRRIIPGVQSDGLYDGFKRAGKHGEGDRMKVAPRTASSGRQALAGNNAEWLSLGRGESLGWLERELTGYPLCVVRSSTSECVILLLVVRA